MAQGRGHLSDPGQDLVYLGFYGLDRPPFSITPDPECLFNSRTHQNAIEKILSYTDAGEESFRSNTMIHDAVIRNFQIIGEASKKLSDDIKSTYPHVPWKSMAGMRDKLIHDYFGVDLDIVWDTIQNFLPTLNAQIEEIITEIDPSS